MTETLTVAITRTPTAAAALTRALNQRCSARGWHLQPVFVPVSQACFREESLNGSLETQRGRGVTAQSLRAAEWVTFTSANGVRGFARWAQAQELNPAEALGRARVACVGRATRDHLAQLEVPVDFVPTVEDARHMLEQWPQPASVAAENNRVVCVQGTNARPTLQQGLRDAGWEVAVLEVYSMHDFPAPTPLQPLDSADATALTLTDAAKHLGECDVLIATAPSLLKKVYRAAHGADFPPVVAIGATTASKAAELRLRQLTSTSPAPDDLADAAIALAASNLSNSPHVKE
ncbi:uroporphyrinogen-III synthase [Rothia sp. LK2588]|uniref:uroporphyrinogen-III synthase n=1 Tax=Rothia sp. LK2588 TaxID=3114369 RepID=UPI0034CDE734